ncbi:carbohydrate ABC transporter permease [Blautia sp. RD014234]|nr:carbohydrate ABC transporter permease [Blautia parvula]
MLVLSVCALLPFYMMIVMGTHYSEDLYTGVKLFFGKYFVENFHAVMRQNFLLYYANSLIVACCNTIGGLLVSALAGYAFAKYDFRGKKPLFAMIVATLAIPQQLGLVGFVMEMRWIGMNNTLFPPIVSGMANAFGVFWMRQFIESSVPDEIIESGRVDGCREFGIFFRLIMPIIRPALITIFLLFFLWSWNNYMTPLVMISDQKYYTIPLSIALISSEYRTDYAARILALSMGTIPILDPVFLRVKISDTRTGGRQRKGVMKFMKRERILAENWYLEEQGSAEQMEIPAMPMQVHDILYHHGRIGDSYRWGKTTDCRWVNDKTWIYRTEFELLSWGLTAENTFYFWKGWILLPRSG